MSTSLSEKAKGKQRVVDPVPEILAPMKDLTIRFTEGIPDLTVQIAEKDTVKDVKSNVSVTSTLYSSTHVDHGSKIRFARPELKDRRLRLIHSGQLLADNNQLYSRILSLEQRRRPTQASSSGDEADEAEDQNAPAPPTWLHCSVGPQLQEGEEEDSRMQVRMYIQRWGLHGGAGQTHRPLV